MITTVDYLLFQLEVKDKFFGFHDNCGPQPLSNNVLLPGMVENNN